jgi:RecA-family ATPase
VIADINIRELADVAWQSPSSSAVTDGTDVDAEFVQEKLDLKVTFAWTLAEKPVPQRRWIVPDWIARQQVTLLTGQGGVGKSLLALQLMVAAEQRHEMDRPRR